MFVVLSFGVVPVTALNAEVAQQAGFDCTLAKSTMETAICASPDIAAADRAMMLAYNALLSLDNVPAFTAALRTDQRSFLQIRQQAWYAATNRQMAIERLLEETELRAEWLNQINPAPRTGLVGTWGNAWGLITIDSSFQVTAEVVDQVAGTWRCGFDGGLVAENNSQATGYTLTEAINIRRDGPLLQVVNDFCDETGPVISGSMKGLYFKIGAETDQIF